MLFLFLLSAPNISISLPFLLFLFSFPEGLSIFSLFLSFWPLLLNSPPNLNLTTSSQNNYSIHLVLWETPFQRKDSTRNGGGSTERSVSPPAQRKIPPEFVSDIYKKRYWDSENLPLNCEHLIFFLLENLNTNDFMALHITQANK